MDAARSLLYTSQLPNYFREYPTISERQCIITSLGYWS